MKIRSVTYFCNPQFPLDEAVLRKAGEFLANAKFAYEAAGYEVQTTRLTTIPFPLLLNGKVEQAPLLAEKLSGILKQIGLAYAALGPALIEFPESYAVIPEAISVGENIFFSGVMADRANGISMKAVKACAEIIQRASSITPDGFANLRFAALANVKSGAPFFPAAYHDADTPAFAIAVESADLAIEAFAGQQTMDDGRRTLISEITKHGQAIARIADNDLSNVRFNGIDFSLAPFPDDVHSLGGAVEAMGVTKVGLHGSLAAAAILTEAVDRADFPHIGFSGFMQPVLEDSILAKRAAEGVLTVKDALLYSAVCGTGLDTVPLAGDVTPEQMTPLLLDLSALAMRLDKPLTARLMPIPGKQAGDVTEFDFGFFANSRVMALESAPLNFPLGGNESFFLNKKS
ncbi:hypothetical protein ANAEL_00244 [Anaerolineales bacterium]|nr:hypothetical protein ANAEL_00244 [Anaerolineales bacterium]